MGLVVDDKGCGVAGGRQGMQGYWLATRDVGLLVGDKGCGVAGGHVERLVEHACVLGRGLKGCNVCVCVLEWAIWEGGEEEGSLMILFMKATCLFTQAR